MNGPIKSQFCTFHNSSFVCIFQGMKSKLVLHEALILGLFSIWVRSRNCGCVVTWSCYQLIARPGNKTATVSWPDPYKAEQGLSQLERRHYTCDVFPHLLRPCFAIDDRPVFIIMYPVFIFCSQSGLQDLLPSRNSLNSRKCSAITTPTDAANQDRWHMCQAAGWLPNQKAACKYK